MRSGRVAALSALIALAVWIARKTPPPHVAVSGPVQYQPALIPRTADCTDAVDLEKADQWPASLKAEQWLRDQVANSKEADFRIPSWFPKAEDRVVRASVLQEVLLRSPAGPKQLIAGVAVRCAIIRDDVNLRYAEIAWPVTLDHVTFLGDVDLSWTHFRRSLRLDGSRFVNDLSLNSAHLDQALFLIGAQFAGAANFIALNSKGAVVASGAEFLDPGPNSALFNSAVVGNTMFFDGAQFHGAASFAHANITLDFRGDRLAADSQYPVNFTHVSCHSLRLSHTSIAGELLLPDVAADVIQLEEPVAGPQAIDLSQTAVRSRLSLRCVSLERLTAPQLRSAVSDFRDVAVRERMDFRNARLGAWALLDARFPSQRTDVWFDGVAFDSIRFTGDDFADRFETLFRWPAQVRYSASVYSALETFLSDQGNTEAAKRIAILQRRDDRARLSGLSWLGSIALDGLIGYGKYPFQALYACGLVVLFGIWLFPNEGVMQAVKKPEGPPPPQFSPFWYSLGLFLPVVDLEMSKSWRPREERRFANHYMRVHILLGWILVPLFAAGLTGLVK